MTRNTGQFSQIFACQTFNTLKPFLKYTLIYFLWQKSSCTLLYYSNVQKTCRTTYIRTFNDNHRVHLFGVCGAAVFLSFSSSEERRFVKNEIINQVVLQIHCTKLHFDRILSDGKLVTVLIFDFEGVLWVFQDFKKSALCQISV